MQFECAIELAAPIEAVFEFHTHPENILLVEPASNFRLLSYDPKLKTGNELWVEKRVGILPIVLGLHHVLCDPPHRLGEELFHGPFQHFYHVHEFAEGGRGTIMKDVIDIECAWYLGGERLTPFLLHNKLRRQFAARHARYRQLESEGRFRLPA